MCSSVTEIVLKKKSKVFYPQNETINLKLSLEFLITTGNCLKIFKKI